MGTHIISTGEHCYRVGLNLNPVLCLKCAKQQLRDFSITLFQCALCLLLLRIKAYSFVKVSAGICIQIPQFFLKLLTTGIQHCRHPNSSLAHLVKRACDIIDTNSRKQRRKTNVFIVVFVNSFAVNASCYCEDVHKGFESKKEQCILD